MSNVFIAATGELGLKIAVNLGPNERKVHSCPAGEDIELTVGGNQTLNISAAEDESTAEAEDTTLPTGADVAEDESAAKAEATELPIGADVAEAVCGGDETEGDDTDQNPVSNLPSAGAAIPVSDSPVEAGNPLKNPFDPNA